MGEARQRQQFRIDCLSPFTIFNLLVAFAGYRHRFNVKAVFRVGFETGQFGSGLQRITNRRLSFDLWPNFRAFHFFVEDSETAQIAVGLFRLLPNQIECRRAERSRLKVIHWSGFFRKTNKKPLVHWTKQSETLIQIILTSFWRFEWKDIASGPAVRRIDDSNADKIDSVRYKLVNEGLWSVANHFTSSQLSFLLRPRLDLVAFEVSWIKNKMYRVESSSETCHQNLPCTESGLTGFHDRIALRSSIIWFKVKLDGASTGTSSPEYPVTSCAATLASPIWLKATTVEQQS